MDALEPGRRSDADALDTWLESLGYARSLVRTETSWVYVVSRRGDLERPPESWRGEGADPETARNAVLWRMFPSGAARRALALAVESGACRPLEEAFGTVRGRSTEQGGPFAHAATTVAAAESWSETDSVAPPAAGSPSATAADRSVEGVEDLCASARASDATLAASSSVPPGSGSAASSPQVDPDPARRTETDGEPCDRPDASGPRETSPARTAPDSSSGRHRADSPWELGRAQPISAAGDDTQEHVPSAAAASPASSGSARLSRMAGARARKPALSRVEALDRIEALEEGVRQSREAIGTLPSYEQRIVILGWVAAAREVQDDAAGDHEVFTRVQALVRFVTDGFCKTLWPGSVRALRFEAQPWDVIDDLAPQDRPADCPRTWGEVARLVHSIEDSFSNEGWADDRALVPEPRAPEAVLDQVAGEIGKVDGVPSREDVERWARYLRWIREATGRPWLWGQTFGRLRRWAAEDRRLAVDELREDFAPPKGSSWASILGHDPERKKRRDEFRRVMRHYPHPADHPPEIARHDWLRRALAFWSTHRDILLARIRADGRWALDVDSDEVLRCLSDRATRRAFRKLLDELAIAEWDAEHDREVLAEYDRESTDDNGDSNGVGEDVEAADAQETETARRHRLGRILDCTRGCSVLFVTNRGLDEGLRDELVQDLELERLEWQDCQSWRKLESVAKSIEAGTYGFVIGATGFMSHSADRLLRQAARKGGALYVAANRARRQACLLALERDLGARARDENGRAAPREASP